MAVEILNRLEQLIDHLDSMRRSTDAKDVMAFIAESSSTTDRIRSPLKAAIAPRSPFGSDAATRST